MRRWALGIVFACLLASTSAPAQVEQLDADRERIRTHLSRVEAELRAVDVSHLDAAQQANRAANLDRLRAYWQAGVFPHNEDFPGERAPIFIDEGGRACAVGHLMLTSGADALARRIAAEGLLDWVANSGLSAAEHARIQPSYCYCSDADEPVCGDDGVTYRNECVAKNCGQAQTVTCGACQGGAGGTLDQPSCMCFGNDFACGPNTNCVNCDGSSGGGQPMGGQGPAGGQDSVGGDGGPGGDSSGGDEVVDQGCSCRTPATPQDDTGWSWLMLALGSIALRRRHHA